MDQRPSFEEFKKRALQNPEVKGAYDLLGPHFALIDKFIKIRKKIRHLDTLIKRVKKILLNDKNIIMS